MNYNKSEYDKFKILEGGGLSWGGIVVKFFDPPPGGYENLIFSYPGGIKISKL